MARFSPSEIIYVDEIFSIWYSLGGEWVNLGMPHYVQMVCKPDDGLKIRDTCCGRII